MKERRSKLRQYSRSQSSACSSSSPRDSVEKEKKSHSRKSSSSDRNSAAEHGSLVERPQPPRKNRSRQRSPHPNAKMSTEQNGTQQQCNCNNALASSASAASIEAVIVHSERPPNQRPKSKSKSRSSSLQKSLKKRVSFDDTPVEISSREASLPKVNGGCENNEAIIDEFELPELQEDDLFSTYESLKAHASPSPPPLLTTDLSKEEKKTLSGKSKSPPVEASRGCSKPLASLTTTKEQPSSLEVESATAVGQSGKPPKPITFRELDVSPLIVSAFRRRPKKKLLFLLLILFRSKVHTYCHRIDRTFFALIFLEKVAKKSNFVNFFAKAIKLDRVCLKKFIW